MWGALVGRRRQVGWGRAPVEMVDGIRFDLTVASQPSQLSESGADRSGSAIARPYRLLLKLSDAQSGAVLADAAAAVQVGGGRRSSNPAALFR